jgi:MATE family multidrug resistance protein
MKDDLRLSISYRSILEMSIPISFAILVPQLNYLINSFFLSKLGVGYLGISGITGVYYLIFSVIGFGLNNGLQAVISRRAGQGLYKEIGTLFTQSIYITLCIAGLGILATYTITPFIFKSNIDLSIYNESISFLSIRIWGLPFLYLYQMRNALLVGTNQSKLLIWGTLSETIANIVLDYGLIFGNFGLPKLGFNGAAYASVIAEFIGMIVVFGIIHVKGMNKRFALFESWKIDWKTTKTLLIQSSPLVLQYAISITSWEFFFILISHDGRMALDISQLMRIVFGFFGIFIWAFAATTNTMVSNVIGQGKNRLVKPLIIRITKLSMGTTLFIFIPAMFFSRELLSLSNTNIEFLDMATPVLKVVAIAILLMSASTIWLNAVTGTGNTVINLSIELITIVLYCIYVYYVMEVWNLSITWGWGSEFVYWISIFVMSFAYIKSGKWKGKVV